LLEAAAADAGGARDWCTCSPVPALSQKSNLGAVEQIDVEIYIYCVVFGQIDVEIYIYCVFFLTNTR